MQTKRLHLGILIIFIFALFGIWLRFFFAMPQDGFITQTVVLTRHDDLLVSPVIKIRKSFNVVALKLPQIISGMVFETDTGAVEPIEVHDDGFGPEAFLILEPARRIQFKKPASPDETSLAFQVDLFFPERNLFGFLEEASANPGADIIKRNEWGADETLRYWNPDIARPQNPPIAGERENKNGNGNGVSKEPCADFDSRFGKELAISKVVGQSPAGDELIWPLQYAQKLHKIVIHHTDSEVRDINGDHRINSRDYKEIVRAIYRFHSLTRGWGDIGYNYLIDPLGNIYEGRFGGDKVVGGHVLCHNNGALGIAIIGNYQENKVPEPALQAAIALVARKAKEHNINPTNSGSFRGRELSNILGHKDLRPTACPGQYLYGLLPRIRERSSLAIRSGNFGQNFTTETLDYNADSVNFVSDFSLSPNERRKFPIQFRNTGKTAWDQNTWLHVPLNNRPEARVVPILEDKNFVAANLKESAVLPGEVGTFEVELEAGYKGGYFNFEVAPVINGRYRVSRATVDLPLTIENPNYAYEVVKSGLPEGTVFQGQTIDAWIDLKNRGNVVWKNYGANQITLGTDMPRDRKSLFVKENPARLGYLLDSEVKPGEVGRFVMSLRIPTNRQMKLVERFTPVIEGVAWLENKGLQFAVNVKKPRHSARVQKLDPPNRMMPGELQKIAIRLENKGDVPWNEDNLEITLLGRGIKVFKNQLTTEKEVNPQKTADLDFWVQAPFSAGQHSVFLRVKYNNIAIRGGATRFIITVPEPVLRAKIVEQGGRSFNLKPGETKELKVKFKNLGNTVWQKSGPNATLLGTANPVDRISPLLVEKEWESRTRPARLVENQVKPGEIGTFIFKINSSKKGVYREYFQLVTENIGWVAGGLVRWDFRVFGDSAKTSRAAAPGNSVTPLPNKIPQISQTPVAARDDITADRPFRVRLSHNAANATLTANKAFKVVDENNVTLFAANAAEPVTVRQVTNEIQVERGSTVKSASIVRFIPNAEGIMEITTWEHRPSWNLSLNDNRFRNILEVRIVENQMAVINELPLEDYLKGLAEVSGKTHLEKQKAIAVLARSYARFYMDPVHRKFPDMPYDGNDDPEIFQKYLGYGMEARSPSFVGSVALTENEIVTYQGKLIKTPYFNQSDGRTRSAQEIWGWTDTPYLISVPDPWCQGLEKKGHGVGLSGCGAEAQAKEGKTYDEIIKYYYQGVEVEEMKFK